MPLAPNVRVIHQTKNLEQNIDETSGTIRKLKVAAYARVSTEEDEQQSSYAAQMDYYTNYIKNKSEWEFAGIYADEGITGTSTKNRTSFNLMIEDALAGKIDLILVKSISRFARNVVDALSITRNLRSHNVRVIFEKENLDTFDPKCETMLAIMATIAQEESRSISENVRWGKRKSMQDGKVSIPYSSFLGYKKDVEGNIAIDEEEATIVREIYDKYIEGYSTPQIAEELTNRHIPTPRKNDVWDPATISSILRNEKYKGDAILQKTFYRDYLDKTPIKNEGQLPQYYVKNSHPAIIDTDTFELVQYLYEERSKIRRSIARNSEISTKLVCGSCGYFYGKKQKYCYGKKCFYWACNHRYSVAKCSNPTIDDELLKNAFVKAFNQIIKDRDSIISESKGNLSTLANTVDLETKVEFARAEYEQAAYNYNQYLLNRSNHNPETHSEEIELLRKAKNESEDKYNNLHKDYISILGKKDRTKRFLNILEKNEKQITEYSPILFRKTIERIVIDKQGVLKFHFMDDTEVTIQAP